MAFKVTGGTVYYVEVSADDAYGCGGESFALSWSSVPEGPPNDFFADSVTVDDILTMVNIALGFLLGRFSGRVLRSGEHLVPEAALEALADQNIPFTVKGKAIW